MCHLPQLFSSEPSSQFLSPLQKRPRSMHLPSPQASRPSSHSGSSVYSKGFALRSLFFNLQFFTASFQSHVCFSMSKNNPAGQRIACRPYISYSDDNNQIKMTQIRQSIRSARQPSLPIWRYCLVCGAPHATARCGIGSSCAYGSR